MSGLRSGLDSIGFFCDDELVPIVRTVRTQVERDGDISACLSLSSGAEFGVRGQAVHVYIWFPSMAALLQFGERVVAAALATPEGAAAHNAAELEGLATLQDALADQRAAAGGAK